jgi:23S rRNA pseudouridine2605 synthase
MLKKRPAAKRSRPGKKSPRSPDRHGFSAVDKLAQSAGEADETQIQSDAQEAGVSSPDTERGGERLQKILSRAGVASRRKAEELIVEGRVTVNGKTITELGSKADLARDHVKVDGRLLHAPKHNVYIALNKPKNCVTTVSDPEGRETVMHLMRGVRERVFPVGRLDYQSEGLLLLTNDGEFAHRITAPTNHVTKVYVVKVNGPLSEEQERAFREGVPMHGRKTAPAEIKMIKSGANPWYEIKITEGRQNQIRVMIQNFGRLVEKLRRVKIAFLELDVPPGRYRSLTSKEIERFKKLLKLDAS